MNYIFVGCFIPLFCVVPLHNDGHSSTLSALITLDHWFIISSGATRPLHQYFFSVIGTWQFVQAHGDSDQEDLEFNAHSVHLSGAPHFGWALLCRQNAADFPLVHLGLGRCPCITICPPLLPSVLSFSTLPSFSSHPSFSGGASISHLNAL